MRDIHVPHPSGGRAVQIGCPAYLSGNPCRNDVPPTLVYNGESLSLGTSQTIAPNCSPDGNRPKVAIRVVWLRPPGLSRGVRAVAPIQTRLLAMYKTTKCCNKLTKGDNTHDKKRCVAPEWHSGVAWLAAGRECYPSVTFCVVPDAVVLQKILATGLQTPSRFAENLSNVVANLVALRGLQWYAQRTLLGYRTFMATRPTFLYHSHVLRHCH